MSQKSFLSVLSAIAYFSFGGGKMSIKESEEVKYKT